MYVFNSIIYFNFIFRWVSHVEKLKNEDQLVHDTCRKQMEKIITELIYEARRIIPNVP